MNKFFAPLRRKKLKSADFTIISNNCWAGHVYRYFGLPYNTPTVGLYIWAQDYMTLLSDLKGFMSQPLEIIDYKESNHFEEIEKRGEISPIGRLNYNGKQVEIVFLHYKNAEEALEKWTRRAKRINYDNLIIKNSYQNGFTDELLKQFDALDYDKKLCFTPKPMQQYNCTVWFKSKTADELSNDTNDFRKYINLISFINGDEK
ncbi:MAG: DUF1919 domain-containing protein [Acutalibacteraceae bacterium]|nr:DUF1919 domain-containing protein [Acutalibacteraceae bacterium]